MESFFASEFGLLLSVLLIMFGVLFFYLGVQSYNMYIQAKLSEFQSGAEISKPIETEAEKIARINEFLREGWEKDGRNLAADRMRLFGV